MQEIWKSLKGVVEYGDYYEISSFGNIRSVDRYVKQDNNGKEIIRKYVGRILSPKIDTYGYLRVNLSLNGKTKQYQMHRLVALVFISNPENKPQVNHIDGDKKNNGVTNLEWSTSKENINHAHRTGLKCARKGEENGNSPLSNEDVRKIRELWETGNISQVKLGKMFNVSRTTIQNVIFYKTWNHID